MITPRKVQHFFIEGTAVDQEAIIRLRQELESRITEDMRKRGYVPVLDITPELFWEYEKDDNCFKYAVICYGQFVGKKKAQKILGMLGPHPIFKEPYTENLDVEPHDNKPE